MKSLDFLRGSVRPVTLLAIVGGVVSMAVYYGITVDAKEAALLLAAFGGLPMGFWFRSREDKAEDFDDDDDDLEEYMEGYEDAVEDLKDDEEPVMVEAVDREGVAGIRIVPGLIRPLT